MRRLRAGMTQKALAAELGLCTLWVRLQEQGKIPCNTLMDYWTAR